MQTEFYVWSDTKQQKHAIATVLVKPKSMRPKCELVEDKMCNRKGILSSGYLFIFFYCQIVFVVSFKLQGQEHRYNNCQHRSTSGRDYVREANATMDRIPCQRWSNTQPHEHGFTHVGDHNFCRNPHGARSQSQVWCYTTDPEVPNQSCSVPYCPPLLNGQR